MSQNPAPPVPSTPFREAESRTEALPACKCGTDAESKFCVKDREYSFVRLLYLLWGGTSIPTRVSFRCVKCGEVFEVTTDPVLCRQYVS